MARNGERKTNTSHRGQMSHTGKRMDKYGALSRKDWSSISGVRTEVNAGKENAQREKRAPPPNANAAPARDQRHELPPPIPFIGKEKKEEGVRLFGGSDPLRPRRQLLLKCDRSRVERSKLSGREPCRARREWTTPPIAVGSREDAATWPRLFYPCQCDIRHLGIFRPARREKEAGRPRKGGKWRTIGGRESSLCRRIFNERGNGRDVRFLGTGVEEVRNEGNGRKRRKTTC